MTPSVELRNITKKFGPVAANDNINFMLMPGEIHSLAGGNGAGKSTLVKIIYGMLTPDSGEIYIDGTAIGFTHPKEAKAHGIGMAHQEMLLVESKSVLENIILGAEPSKFGFIRYDIAAKKTDAINERFKLKLNLRQKVAGLTVGERQRILISQLLYNNSRILILDEPTAALTPQETDILFGVLKSLREEGASVIFISHRLPEVLKISDRISVLRNGRLVKSLPRSEARPDDIMELMCGEKLPERGRPVPVSGEEKPFFTLNNIVSKFGKCPLKGVSLAVGKSEIVGILGIDGNGQKELEEIVSGQSGNYSGAIKFGDVLLPKGDPSMLRKLKIGYIPAHREINGIIPDLSVAENCILGRHRYGGTGSRIMLDKKRIDRFAGALITRYSIQPSLPDVPAWSLSGGNQQKVVLSREMYEDPPVLLAFNPTRGVDIKTAFITHNRLLQLAASGTATLLILNDIGEAVTLCSRIAILYDGAIKRIFHRGEYSETELGYHMLGGQ
ncbi:ABC transporter ATP-binding protein [candidate division KSB1 bacterium]